MVMAPAQVDSIDGVQGRLPAWYLLGYAEESLGTLERESHARMENGELPADALFDKPVLNYSWLLRWRRAYKVSWRAQTLRLKCSKETLCRRLLAFWQNVLRLRCCMSMVMPGTVLEWVDSDQKPLWFTGAGALPTLTRRGAQAGVH